MNNLLSIYKDDVLVLFKNHYRRLITKSIDITFDEIFMTTMQELNLSNVQRPEVLFLEQWFKNIHHQYFFQNFLKDDFTEIIFHSHQNIQVFGMHQKESYEMSELTLEDFHLSLEVFALKNKMTWNYKDPFVSFNAKIKEFDLRATLIHFSTSSNEKSKLFLSNFYNIKEISRNLSAVLQDAHPALVFRKGSHVRILSWQQLLHHARENF